MGLKLEPKYGDTELSIEELEMLIPQHVTNRKELDEVEQDNIEEAFKWLFSVKKMGPEKIFSVGFQDILHKKMLGNVWKWAGIQRAHLTNIGVPPNHITVERKKLNDDALFWLQNKTWEPAELAVRYHHRLVQIHCYPNGNGRHARIIADIILEKIFALPPVEWLYTDLVHINDGRKKYIAALKAADQGDYTALLNSIKR